MNHPSDSIDKRQVENLNNMESLLTKALVSGDTALWHWKGDGKNVYLSASYYLMLGYKPYEPCLKENGMIDHIHPKDRVKTEFKLKKCFDQNSKNINLEFRSVCKTGQILWMSFKGELSKSPNGPEKKIMLGVVSNISKHKETEKTLSEKESRQETLMNLLPGMVYINRMIDGDWHAEYASNGVTALLGYEKAFFMANRQAIYTQSVDENDRNEIWKVIDKSIKDNGPFEVVFRLKTASGDYKWVWEKGEVLLDKEGVPILMQGFMMDITTFKHEEFRLQSFIRSASRERYRFGNIIGKSPEMQIIYEFISTAAVSDASVIIYGESGTGKELVARAIHKTGKRRKGPLVIVNCAAISEKLLESEFFGYKKGAFTGANTDKEGFIAAAEGGTLFLDELGEISLEFQVKLLRMLDGHGYTPVGGNISRKADVRIIAATNKNLEELVRQGKMRKDFFYRIHIIPITVPPLSKRRQDIPLLIDHFLEKHKKTGPAVEIPGNIHQALYEYSWPGNIRELENVIQRYVVLGVLEPFGNKHIHIPESQSLPEISNNYTTGDLKTILDHTEKQVILDVLRKNEWRKGMTAEALNITPRTLYRKIMYHHIKPT